MWELRDHRYGGRVKRYRDSPKGVLRCLDPLTKQPVAFPNELQFENWLLYWANCDVRELVVSPGRYSCLEQGKLISIKPHLLIKWADNNKYDEIQIIAPSYTKSKTSSCCTIQKIASANKVNWSVRTRREIRQNTVLLDNLLYIRQCLAITADDEILNSLDYVHNVIKLKNSYRRYELFAELSGVCSTETQMDAILFHLMRSGKISILIESEIIGSDTHIKLADNK